MDSDSAAAEKREKTENGGEPKPLFSADGSSGAADVAKARWTLLRQVQPVVRESEAKFTQTIGLRC